MTTPRAVITRRAHSCCFCEGRIEKGEACESGVELPSQNPYLDGGPWRWYAHPDCRAFYLACVYPETGGEWEDWGECKAEYGWDAWMAVRRVGGES